MCEQTLKEKDIAGRIPEKNSSGYVFVNRSENISVWTGRT